MLTLCEKRRKVGGVAELTESDPKAEVYTRRSLAYGLFQSE